MQSAQKSAQRFDPRELGAECDRCPLGGKPVVPPEPARGKLRLIVIGEGPGTLEVRKKRPFVGPSGKMLDGLLREAGMYRADCHVTNATLCQPTNSDDKYELETAVACCSGRLAKELSALPKELPILSLGAAAARLTIGKSGIMRYRGFVWTTPEIKPGSIRNAQRLWEKRIDKKRRTKDTEKALNAYRMLQARAQITGRTVIPTVHPAMILRGADTWLPVLRIDIKRATRIALGKLRLDQLADTGKFQVVSTVRDAKKALKGFSRLVNVDLETDSPDPMRAKITCCGIADVNDLEHIVLLSPWKPAFGEFLKTFLRKRTVVTHNGPAFDVIVCAERHNIVFGKNEDTLIGHRSFASHMPQSLAHVGSVYTDTGPWKNRFKTTEEKGAVAGFGVKEEDLPEYCAADVRIGSLCWTRMQPDLAKVEALYREDMALAEVYTQMQRTGLYVDEARRQGLMKKLKHRAAALIGEMREMLRRPSFKPTPIEIRRALYKQLRAPLWLAPFTPTGLPSTSKLVLEALRGSEDYPAAGKLADLLTRWRSANDARSEYLDVYIHTDGRVHASWKQVETGRPATRNPNLLNIPRMEMCEGCGVLLLDGCKHGKWKKVLDENKQPVLDGNGKPFEKWVECKKKEEPQPESQLRDIYCAPPGKVWVYFDLKQAELVFAAYLSGDPNFIEACKGDPHTENACVLFPDGADMIRADPKGAGFKFRQIGKTCGLAVGYGAEAAKVFATLRQNEFDVDMDQVETMLDRLKERYQVFFKWAWENVDFANRHGYLEIPFSGRKRWVGFHAKPNLAFNCLDDETEALTLNGWVRGFDLKVGDKLLTKNAKTGRLEWKPIQRMYKWPKYRGPLIEFKSRTFNAVTTPAHRWLVHDRKRHVDVCQTSEVLAQGFTDFSVHRTGHYEPSGEQIYTNDFVELVGWVLTDGHVKAPRPSDAPRVYICQSLRGNREKVHRIDALVRRLDPDVTRKTSRNGMVIWTFKAQSNITRTVVDLFSQRTLTVSFLLALSKEQLRLLLDTMMMGDGTGKKGVSHRRFVCRDRDRADVFQFLCTLNGIATTARWRGPSRPKKQYKSIDNRPQSRGVWTITLLQRETYGQHHRPVNQVRRFTKKVPIWCPVVPNTYFVARRRGDVFITGNTPVQGAVAAIMAKKILELEKRKTRNAQLIIYHYDALIYEVPVVERDDMERIVKDAWKEPILVPHNGLSWVQKIDMKIGERWSQL